MCTQELKFNKMNFFNQFIKDVLNYNWCSFSASSRRWRMQWPLASTVGATALIHAKAPALLPSLLLHHQCKCQPAEKDKLNLSAIIKIVFDLSGPLKGSQRAPASTDHILRSANLQYPKYFPRNIFCGLHRSPLRWAFLAHSFCKDEENEALG